MNLLKKTPLDSRITHPAISGNQNHYTIDRGAIYNIILFKLLQRGMGSGDCGQISTLPDPLLPTSIPLYCKNGKKIIV